MVDEGAAPNCDGPGGADLRHRLIFQARLGKQRHIVGGGVVVVVVEPAGVGKGAVFHPQLRRLLVHHRHKIRLAPRRVASDGHGRVVSRLKQQAVQQSPQGDLLPRLQIDGRTLAAQPLPFDAHYFVQVPRLLYRHQGGEQLRGAGDEPGLVDVVFIEHPAAGCVHKDSAGRVGAHAIGRRTCGGQQQSGGEHNGQFFHKKVTPI